jgi:Phage portal protein
VARFGARLIHAWNAFIDSDSAKNRPIEVTGGGGSYFGGRPDRTRPRFSNERSIISSVYTRIGIDVAAVPMRHVRTDDQNRYLEDINSGLDSCLTLEANVDQAGRAFRQDIAMTVMDEGVAVIVPVDTTLSPETSGGYDIKTLRVGRVTSWFPQHVRVSLYNEARGMREELTLPKRTVAIVENPLYSVMNEPNSTLQRLIRKLNLLDETDEKASSGKLDLIVQLPYVIKSEARRQQAEQRRKDIEFQLSGSKYGIAYTDGTEKVVQLNRPVENNLLPQIQDLKTQLYGELGITPEVMNGTADEKVMLNYYARTIEPMLDAIVEAMLRVFLTKTARTQGQSIMYFRDPFKFVPIGGEGGIADIADKFTRNEITSSNEIRQAIGMKPSQEPKADKLINSNMPQGDTGVDPNAPDPAADDAPDPSVDAMNSGLADSEAEIDAALAGG